MKSIASILLLLALCGSSAFGAVAFGDYNDPGHPGKCTIDEQMILSPGEEVTDHENCARVSCEDNGQVMFASCPVGGVGACELGDYIDKTLPYPDCCERHIICPK